MVPDEICAAQRETIKLPQDSCCFSVKCNTTSCIAYRYLRWNIDRNNFIVFVNTWQWTNFENCRCWKRCSIIHCVISWKAEFFTLMMSQISAINCPAVSMPETPPFIFLRALGTEMGKLFWSRTLRNKSLYSAYKLREVIVDYVSEWRLSCDAVNRYRCIIPVCAQKSTLKLTYVVLVQSDFYRTYQLNIMNWW